MKTSKIIWAMMLAFAIKASAEDTFPTFSETSLKLKIPTGMQGYQATPEDVIGTNAVYAFTGQIFTNAASLQTVAEGFSGTTDRSTPWKTLTELLAVYQRGSDEKQMRSLYTASAQSFLDQIYGKPNVAAGMRAYGSSMTGMQPVLGFDFDNGFIAILNVSKAGGGTYMNPFYLVKTNGTYLLSTFRVSDKRIENILVFFNKHSAAELAQ